MNNQSHSTCEIHGRLMLNTTGLMCFTSGAVRQAADRIKPRAPFDMMPVAGFTVDGGHDV